MNNFLDSGRAEWRERNNIVRIFSEKKIDNMELFQKLIFDDAFEVRISLLVNIPSLNYSDSSLLEVIKLAADNDDYQIRQMAAMIIIIKELYNSEEGLNLLTKLSEDSVCNVRLVVAKYTPRNLPIISKLANDEDEDVSNFASSSVCCSIFDIKKENNFSVSTI